MFTLLMDNIINVLKDPGQVTSVLTFSWQSVNFPESQEADLSSVLSLQNSCLMES